MKTFTFMCCFMIAAVFVQGQIIHVPTIDYPTIQSGINAANPGDTVLVSDGTYSEQINFLSKKPLMVASEFLMDGDTNHIANTVIDGSQINDPDSASIVYFISGEDTTSILYGFTITQGKGTYHNYTISGGAIFIHESGAKIVHNHITGNDLNDFGDKLSRDYNYFFGAGICIWGFLLDSIWTVIDHNVIDLNSCSSGLSGTSGGGICSLNAHTKIINNIISGNSCIGVSGCYANGASFACKGSGQAIVRNNIIMNNYSHSVNNYANAAGGYFEGISGLFADNVVENNEVITWSTSGGVGGLYIAYPRLGTVVCNNIFRNNTSNLFAGGLCLETTVGLDTNQVLVENNYFLGNVAKRGGAFISFDVPVVFLNNVFKGNHATDIGGALSLQYSSTQQDHLAILVNNSFSGNSAGYYGGAIYSNKFNPLVFNCIFWKDTSNSNSPEILFNTGGGEIAWSNIDTNKISGLYIAGDGIINDDPQFDDPDLLTLLITSPCIDAGTEVYTCECGEVHTCPGYDIIGTGRPQSAGFEMGAYEIMFDGTPEVVGHPEPVSIYPNPFSGRTMIEYQLEYDGTVKLTIFNHLGQEVQVLVNEVQNKGKHQVIWDAETQPAGIYFYRLTTDDCRLTTGKLVKY